MELLSTTAERTVCIQAGVTILFQFLCIAENPKNNTVENQV